MSTDRRDTWGTLGRGQVQSIVIRIRMKSMIRSKFNAIDRLVSGAQQVLRRERRSTTQTPRTGLLGGYSGIVRVMVRWETAKYSQLLFRHPLLWPRRVREYIGAAPMRFPRNRWNPTSFLERRISKAKTLNMRAGFRFLLGIMCAELETIFLTPR